MYLVCNGNPLFYLDECEDVIQVVNILKFIVDIVMGISGGQLIRSKPPLVVNNELVLMDAAFDWQDQVEFVAVAVHWNSLVP